MPTEAPKLENSFKSYRISEGKVRIGRKADGTEEVLDSISGFLRRVGYHEGETETGDKYAFVECDLEDVNGDLIRVKSSVGLNSTSSNVAPVGFALGLLACKENDDIGIFPQLSKNPDPKYGKFSTYVNIGVVNPSSGKYISIKPNRDDFPGETSKQKWPHVLEALRKHECYSARPTSDQESGNATDLSIFQKIDSDGVWPSPFGLAKETYLNLLSDMAEREISEYSDLSQEEVENFKEGVLDHFAENGYADIPEDLLPFVEQKKKSGFGKKAS